MQELQYPTQILIYLISNLNFEILIASNLDSEKIFKFFFLF